ncbi:hypothetical protein AURDEDRAFT_183865 [Auricularia subglabra TFB-10046 SS5]|nr:hypothetical protein AURDEDRAFT_183865 [Auricularia subglabra TFB-10046 SS5]
MRKVEFTGIKPQPQTAPSPAAVLWTLYILVQGAYMPLLEIPAACILALRAAREAGTPATIREGASDDELFILDWFEELGVKYFGFSGELSFDLTQHSAAFRPVPPGNMALVAVDPLCIFPQNQPARVEDFACTSLDRVVAGIWRAPSLAAILQTLHAETRHPGGRSHESGRDAFKARLLDRDQLRRATCGFSGATTGVEATHIISRNMGTPYMCALASKYMAGSPWPDDALSYSINGAYNGVLSAFNARTNYTPSFGIFVTPGRWDREKVIYAGMGKYDATQPYWGWLAEPLRYTLHHLEPSARFYDVFRNALSGTGKDYVLIDEPASAAGDGGYRLKNPGSYPVPFVCDVSYAAAMVAKYKHPAFGLLLDALRVQARDLGFTTDEPPQDDDNGAEAGGSGGSGEQRSPDDVGHGGDNISGVPQAAAPHDGQHRAHTEIADDHKAPSLEDPVRPYTGRHISDYELCLALIPRPAVDVAKLPADFVPAFCCCNDGKSEGALVSDGSDTSLPSTAVSRKGCAKKKFLHRPDFLSE